MTGIKHKKVISLAIGEQEGVAGSYPAMVAVTAEGEVYVRQLSTLDTKWENMSITEASIMKKDNK